MKGCQDIWPNSGWNWMEGSIFLSNDLTQFISSRHSLRPVEFIPIPKQNLHTYLVISV